MAALTATCLCGDVSYAIMGPLRHVLHCHCEICRKAHAAAFRSRGSAMSKDIRWIRGEPLVSYFESSPGVRRGFCRRCGSPMLTQGEAMGDTVGIPLGILDQDPDIQPSMHIFVRSMVPWIHLADELPRFETALSRCSRASSGVALRHGLGGDQ